MERQRPLAVKPDVPVRLRLNQRARSVALSSSQER